MRLSTSWRTIDAHAVRPYHGFSLGNREDSAHFAVCGRICNQRLCPYLVPARSLWDILVAARLRRTPQSVQANAPFERETLRPCSDDEGTKIMNKTGTVLRAHVSVQNGAESPASPSEATNAGSGQEDSEERELQRRFAPFAAKMQREELPAELIKSFRYYYNQLLHGVTGEIPREEAQPVEDLPALESVNGYSSAGVDALQRTVVIKLNGGLGTTMGLEGPKASIVVKDGLTFLDIAIRQVLYMREEYAVRLPMVLMNSFNTRPEAMETLADYPELHQDVPLDFLQHKVPRIWKDDLSPVEWSPDPMLEWCPPGHGDIYPALQTSSTLTALLENGYEYAFISNIDNLGATLDLDLLGHFAEQDIPILMEAAKRTPADRKGGHLAMHPDKGLILREIAQCPPDELEQFQDIQLYPYFNTNNLWVNLRQLRATLEEHDGLLELPLIRNEKPVDPKQPDTPPVYQLETAMGQAIAVFPHSEAIRVSHARFLPVKDTNDLLAVWSDAFQLADDFTLHASQPEGETVQVDLDDEYYRLFHQLEERFADGVPSLVDCTRFRVRGNVYFSDETSCVGDVSICHEGGEPLHYSSPAD